MNLNKQLRRKRMGFQSHNRKAINVRSGSILNAKEINKQLIDINFLARILLSYLTFIVLIYFLNRNNSNRLTSFLLVNLSALFALVVLSFRLNHKIGFNLLKIILIGYLIKLLIGYLFWEFYQFPDYFSNPSSIFKFNHREFLLTEVWMKDMAKERISEGFFYLSQQTLNTKHYQIHYLMSNLYLSGSFNPFDIAVQNDLFSIYTSIIVLAISKHLGATSRQMKYALIIAIFQPFSMISSTIFRDIVGQFFVALGGYLTLLSINRKTHIAILLLLIASFSMLIQRYLYFFFPTLCYTAYMIIKSKNKYQLLYLPFIIGPIIYLNNQFSLSDDLSSYGENLTVNNLWIYLPLNLLRIFIGAFPWNQWLLFNDNTIFQIAEYFQSVITISLVILCIKGFMQKRFLSFQRNSTSLFLIILFIPFVFGALGTVDIHQGYMTTGAIFLIPPVISVIPLSKFIRLNLFILLLFLYFNAIFISSGLSGTGIGASTR